MILETIAKNWQNRIAKKILRAAAELVEFIRNATPESSRWLLGPDVFVFQRRALGTPGQNVGFQFRSSEMKGERPGEPAIPRWPHPYSGVFYRADGEPLPAGFARGLREWYRGGARHFELAALRAARVEIFMRVLLAYSARLFTSEMVAVLPARSRRARLDVSAWARLLSKLFDSDSSPSRQAAKGQRPNARRAPVRLFRGFQNNAASVSLPIVSPFVTLKLSRGFCEYLG